MIGQTWHCPVTPLMVDIRTDRTRYYGGDPLALEFWVCNDREAPFPEGKLIWEVRQGARRVFAQSTMVDIPSYDPKFAGFFRYKTPLVGERTPLTIRLGLLDADGKVIHASEQVVEVFPPLDRERNQGRVAAIVGEKGGRAWKLAEELGLEMGSFSQGGSEPTLVIVDTPEDLEHECDAVLDYVKAGGTALLLEQKAGAVWSVGEQEVKVTGITGREFVSRKTGHRLVEGFKSSDFAYWYDPGADRIDYVLNAFLEGEGQPVLVTTGWWTAAKSAAVLEAPLGQGTVVISQLRASRRVGHNPIAAEFYQRIIEARVRKPSPAG